ncbi:S8 family peptidase [Actinomadura hibisca]|uniref:S8 family peptidase n=1 Tax=Actinomadura hibisca TaxID=68565 RepID=UPI0008332EE7|nr:S8 family peptidase [Actinomadura hibisca]
MRGWLAGCVVLVAVAGCGSSAKADPMRDQQWALNAMKLPGAWKRDATGRGVTIAVVDTGADLGHPDLKDNLVDGYDFVDNDDEPKDQNGHGTHVSGIAAAVTDNGVGIAGSAPDARIMPVRALNTLRSGDNATITKAILWAADHGAKVINLSLGESGLMSRLIKGGVLNQAFTYAHGKGAVVVAAAGNDGTAKQPYRVSTPVLIVGASDQRGRPAEFTNVGAQEQVTAPGVGVLSTLPTYRTPETKDGTSGYGRLDGTSMAAPQVSALAALLAGQGRTPDQIMQTIRQTATNPARDPRLGLGIVDAAAAVQQ